MATLLLSAAGAATGGAFGGSFLGVSGAMLGRAAGATLGRMVDQKLMGSGSEPLDRGRVDRFRLTGAGEGAPIAQLHGRTRIAGQVIWSSDFTEHRRSSLVGGGKGGGSSAEVRDYSYSVSLAVALCEGEISHVGRIWADGVELPRNRMTLRVYRGTVDQLPDPKIAAIEGADRVPAYRGVAYVIFDDLDLGQFGNRVPQFSFEVSRPDRGIAPDGVAAMAESIQAVALIPGTGEYALATDQVHYAFGPGNKAVANVHGGDGQADVLTSLDSLQDELPNCKSVSLVVSWFGDDLRAGHCSLRPKVEHRDAEGTPIEWSVAGLDRLAAPLVARQKDQPVYGATPADESVVQVIHEMKDRQLSVLFYPFILMDQVEGNGLPDPWGGNEQPALPWRGRITTERAPGQPGSLDGTSSADTEIDAFFGTARAMDFTVSNGRVQYDGPEEWGMRRFILHFAALCAAAGGVDAFCIGSEMRSLTQIRGLDGFPAVKAMRQLASEVRALLGPETKIGYAADWSEYFGYAPSDGSGDRYFHLDPLWADENIDFIGIDNYMPLSDWRDEANHADAGWGEIHDLDYLRSNIGGGEGFDWYYADAEAAQRQERTPITDGAHDEPWIWRYKDIRSWWSLPHHERVGGVRMVEPTAWQPMSKPIWFTEFGCAAVDKGTNEPNKFLDPKSSESGLPRASNGSRDDLIQMQYIRATCSYWKDAENNPVSPVYGGAMIDMAKAHVWAWDARPWPRFPGLADVWSDRDNYACGHWLNGRTSSRLLSSVVGEICDQAGLQDADCSVLHGLVRGYSVAEPGMGRACLEPLMIAFGFQGAEVAGKLAFTMQGSRAPVALNASEVAEHPENAADLQFSRAADGEMAGRIQLVHVGADESYETRVSEAIHPGDEALSVSSSELPLVLTEAEARRITERWLSETRVAREAVQLALPPSRLTIAPGEVLAIDGPNGMSHWRIDRLDQFSESLVEAVRIEPAVFRPADVPEKLPNLASVPSDLPVTAVFLDLPLLTGEEVPHTPHLAVTAQPWPGEVAVYSSVSDVGYQLNSVVDRPAAIGTTLGPMSFAAPGLLDNGAALIVHMPSGGLSSVSREVLLSGANAMAIGDGSADGWEIFQFQDAELVGPDTWALRRRLRGQLGTDAVIPGEWPAGSIVVLLDGALTQISLPMSARGLERHYRICPAGQAIGGPNAVHQIHAFQGNGLRPYAPVGLTRRRADDEGHRFGWIRRTRVDGDLWGAADVPIGEASERYLVRILVDGDVRRTDEVTVPEWHYGAGQRSDDGIEGSYFFEVAQVSDRFGPGYFGRMSIDD